MLLEWCAVETGEGKQTLADNTTLGLPCENVLREEGREAEEGAEGRQFGTGDGGVWWDGERCVCGEREGGGESVWGREDRGMRLRILSVDGRGRAAVTWFLVAVCCST